jgi:2'-5' RNA ligase
MTHLAEHAMQEHEVTLMLLASAPMSREDLEASAMHAEATLVARAHEFALGAATAANFAQSSIEIDFVVSVASPAEVHDCVARVVRILQEAGFNSQQEPKAPPLQLASSATHAVAVCA